MTRLSSLRLEWRGRRLLRQRLACAVLGRPASDTHVLREQEFALKLGCLIASVVLVVAAGLALLKPAAAPGSARLVMMRDSGALFVRLDDRWHPVANLPSARLILGHPVSPYLIGDRQLGAERGALLGIPGAPQEIGRSLEPSELRWAVCDGSDETTTVVTGFRGGTELDSGSALLATAAAGGGATYLVRGGRRALIDPSDPVIERTFGTSAIRPRPFSPALLNLLPELPQLVAPRIAARGRPSLAADYPVGSVLRVTRASSVEFYVVLREGLQRVSPVAADLVRFADPDSDAGPAITSVTPDVVAASPLVDQLPTADYPDEIPVLLDHRDELCVTWHAGRTAVMVNRAQGGSRVRLAHGDGPGPMVDFVEIPSGRNVDVTAIPLGEATGSGTRYLITDTGGRYAVPDSESAAALGVGGSSAVAPWSLIAELPPGPELGRQAALNEFHSLGLT